MNRTIAKSLLIAVVCLTGFAFSEQTKIIASQPTHYFYLPMAKVNPANSLVLSLHEASYAFPNNLQVEGSIFDNIGRIDLGGKYGIQDNLSVGLGLAYSIAHMGTDGYGHGIKRDDVPRLGAFLCYGFLNNPAFEAVVVPHTQLFGAANSIGCDLGGMATPSNFWSFIWEIGTSYDITSNDFYFNVDGGLRIHPPSIPFLSFDCGVDAQEFDISVDHPHTEATIFLDCIFAMVTK